MKYVKIQYHGGDGRHVYVTDAATGREIPRVFRVEMTLDAEDDVPVARLYTYAPLIDVELPATFVQVCSCCEHVLEESEMSSHHVE